MKTRASLILVLALLIAGSGLGSEKANTSIAERSRQPYAGIDWARANHVVTFSHGHVTSQEQLDSIREAGIGFYTLSNYYPSAPWYPMASIRSKQFNVLQEHSNGIKGEMKSGPFRWNEILMDPASGWYKTLPAELQEQLPFKVGGPVFTDLPSALLEAPNAEHHGFSNLGRLHVCSPGSFFASGNFDARHRFLLRKQGYTSGAARTWEEGFALMLESLMFPDGGGITINHPVWSRLSFSQICEMLDHDPRVLGIEIFNGTIMALEKRAGGETFTQEEELWDAILKTGRQCFGFFVPDHQLHTPGWKGRNILLVEALTVEACLQAYRRGDFYGAIRATGLRFESIAADDRSVRVRTNGASLIEFITEEGVALAVTSAEGEYILPRSERGHPKATFVRIRASDAQGERIFSQPFIYTGQ